MPNFSATNLVKAQARLKQKFTEAEMRTKQRPAVALATKNTSILIPGHEQLRTREDRAIEANILRRSKRSTTNSRTHDHTGNRGDSFTLPLTWTTITDTFSISLKQMDNNIFNFTETLAQQLLNAELNIIEDIETFMIDFLFASRTQVNAATTGGSFNAGNDAFEISAADKARFYQFAKSMMRQNNYQGIYDVIASSATYVQGEYDAAQGNSNSTNLGFQFQNLNIAESTELDDTNYPGGISLIMPAGQFAILPWIPKQNREGWGDYNSYVGGFGSMESVIGAGLTYALHIYADRADTSAANGNTQDVVLQAEMSVDIAPALSPLATANESIIFEVAQLS